MENFCGFSPAVVTDNVDPDNIGRLRVRFTGFDERDDKEQEVWARLTMPVAGNQRGAWLIPEVGDEVLVAFESGEVRQSYVIGSLWSKNNPPPEAINSQNDKKFLRLRSGLQITISEVAGQESFVVETPGGQSLTLKDGPGAIEIADSMGNRVTLEARGVSIQSSAQVTVTASVVEVNAGMVRVQSPMAKFDGIVMCNMLISNSVVSASYTPGAGNIW